MSEPAPDREPIVRSRGVVKSYRAGRREVPVLRGVDLDVMPGEVLAIVGPSGAGKSTLLHILGLIDRPTNGTVWMRGRETSRMDARRVAGARAREVGFVFQFYHLLPDLTAFENVLLPARVASGLFGWPGVRRMARQRAEELLTRVGLAERMHHRPNQLSGGERQRVAIARALVNDPPLLLADEPTGNLDTRTGREVLDLLLSLRQAKGATLVIVTHDPHVAEVADRRAHMVDGLLEIDGEDRTAPGEG